MSEAGAGNDLDDRENGQAETRYRAPALEKGLDILDLLVTEARPLTMTEICKRLNRSQGEMFRMVHVLHVRGFLAQDEAAEGYYLTDRLFTMAMRQPPTKGLVETALPYMRTLAMEIGQSCHLAMHARGEIVVVARMESMEQIGFSVRVGYRRAIHKAASGISLFGFQPAEVRAQWLKMLPDTICDADIADFISRADAARERGYAKVTSSFVGGVTDVSVPIIRGDRAAAALTIPFIKHANHPIPITQVTQAAMAMAGVIASKLIENDNRA